METPLDSGGPPPPSPTGDTDGILSPPQRISTSKRLRDGPFDILQHISSMTTSLTAGMSLEGPSQSTDPSPSLETTTASAVGLSLETCSTSTSLMKLPRREEGRAAAASSSGRPTDDGLDASTSATPTACRPTTSHESYRTSLLKPCPRVPDLEITATSLQGPPVPTAAGLATSTPSSTSTKSSSASSSLAFSGPQEPEPLVWSLSAPSSSEPVDWSTLLPPSGVAMADHLPGHQPLRGRERLAGRRWDLEDVRAFFGHHGYALRLDVGSTLADDFCARALQDARWWPLHHYQAAILATEAASSQNVALETLIARHTASRGRASAPLNDEDSDDSDVFSQDEDSQGKIVPRMKPNTRCKTTLPSSDDSSEDDDSEYQRSFDLLALAIKPGEWKSGSGQKAWKRQTSVPWHLRQKLLQHEFSLDAFESFSKKYSGNPESGIPESQRVICSSLLKNGNLSMSDDFYSRVLRLKQDPNKQACYRKLHYYQVWLLLHGNGDSRRKLSDTAEDSEDETKASFDLSALVIKPGDLIPGRANHVWKHQEPIPWELRQKLQHHDFSVGKLESFCKEYSGNPEYSHPRKQLLFCSSLCEMGDFSMSEDFYTLARRVKQAYKQVCYRKLHYYQVWLLSNNNEDSDVFSDDEDSQGKVVPRAVPRVHFCRRAPASSDEELSEYSNSETETELPKNPSSSILSDLMFEPGDLKRGSANAVWYRQQPLPRELRLKLNRHAFSMENFESFFKMYCRSPQIPSDQARFVSGLLEKGDLCMSDDFYARSKRASSHLKMRCFRKLHYYQVWLLSNEDEDSEPGILTSGPFDQSDFEKFLMDELGVRPPADKFKMHSSGLYMASRYAQCLMSGEGWRVGPAKALFGRGSAKDMSCDFEAQAEEFRCFIKQKKIVAKQTMKFLTIKRLGLYQAWLLEHRATTYGGGDADDHERVPGTTLRVTPTAFVERQDAMAKKRAVDVAPNRTTACITNAGDAEHVFDAATKSPFEGLHSRTVSGKSVVIPRSGRSLTDKGEACSVSWEARGAIPFSERVSLKERLFHLSNFQSFLCNQLRIQRTGLSNSSFATMSRLAQQLVSGEGWKMESGRCTYGSNGGIDLSCDFLAMKAEFGTFVRKNGVRASQHARTAFIDRLHQYQAWLLENTSTMRESGTTASTSSFLASEQAFSFGKQNTTVVSARGGKRQQTNADEPTAPSISSSRKRPVRNDILATRCNAHAKRQKGMEAQSKPRGGAVLAPTPTRKDSSSTTRGLLLEASFDAKDFARFLRESQGIPNRGTVCILAERVARFFETGALACSVDDVSYVFAGLSDISMAEDFLHFYELAVQYQLDSDAIDNAVDFGREFLLLHEYQQYLLRK